MSDHTPDYVYAASRPEAQRLLDESYLGKYVAVPWSERNALTTRVVTAEAALRHLAAYPDERVRRIAKSALGHRLGRDLL